MSQLLDAIEHRRSYYQLSSDSPISDERIEEIISEIIKYMPSAFNSQSSRLVLLLGESHLQLWDIVKNVIKARVDDDTFSKTEKKIDGMFRSGHGTVLFYEDQTVVKGLQEQYPAYADNMPIHSVTTGAMHQFAVWTALEAEGLGASLQHYNPIIDQDVAKAFNIPDTWELKAEMPFGKPLAKPGNKTFQPISERFKVIK